jgi:Tfp pilus assembly protein PilF
LLAQAEQQRPDDPQIRDDLAAALDQLGLSQEAKGQFATAISDNPDDPDVHANYGTFLARHGLFVDATGEFHAALNIDPDNPIAKKGMDFIHLAEMPTTRPTVNN